LWNEAFRSDILNRVMDTLNRRALNRATLHRQALLKRAEMTPVQAVERLVGLQAQAVNAPYLGLWARLASFTKDDLTKALYDRTIVRGGSLRGTQHLLTAADYLWIRPLIKPLTSNRPPSAFATQTRDVDMAELRDTARVLLRGRTLTRPQLGKALAERWPGHDPTALGLCAQSLLPLLHTPPSGTWGKGGAVPCVLAEEWIGRPLHDAPDPADLIRRYLAAFGPASIQDLQIWSGLTRAADRALFTETAARLPGLRRFRDEEGRDLYDLEDAPLPDPDTPAPPRFLPEFDNLLVAHADRTRLMTDETRRRVITGSLVRPTFLIDGMVRGTWTLPKTGPLTLTPFSPLTPTETESLTQEATHLLKFVSQGNMEIFFS
jgi:hypothetical protein